MIVHTATVGLREVQYDTDRTVRFGACSEGVTAERCEGRVWEWTCSVTSGDLEAKRGGKCVGVGYSGSVVRAM